MAKAFSKLTEQEILALAVAQEEEDSRIYGDFAERFRATYPATPRRSPGCSSEESEHRQRLIDGYRARFGEHLPLIQRSGRQGPGEAAARLAHEGAHRRGRCAAR
jgi:erythrin-vacuolar iron transport family protein